MAETLLIRLEAGAAGIREWLLVDELGDGKSPVRAGAPDAGIVQGARRIVVLIPALETYLDQASVPGRNRQRVLRMIPFVLEEKVAADVDDLHFAVGAMQEGNTYPVAVVAHQQMLDWAGMLKEHGIQAEQWIPETLTLPYDEGESSVMVDGETTIIRSAAYAGMSMDTDSLPVMLTLLESSEQAPEQVRLLGSAVPDLGDIEVQVSEQDLQPLEWMAKGWAQGKLIDLLQGTYSHREEWGRLLRPWIPAAIMLLVGLLVSGALTSIDYSRLSEQQARLAGEIEEVYRDAFPNAKRIVNPRAQMEQKLKQLQSGSGTDSKNTAFIPMLAKTAEIIRATKGIKINGASYRNSRIDLDLEADDLQILDKLKQDLGNDGVLKAEIQSATTNKNKKIKSRMRIQGGKP